MATDRLGHLHTILKMPDPLRVVDIGANPMNSVAPYKSLLDRDMCRLTGFEPQEDTLVQINAQKGKNETYIPAAIGDGAEHQLNLYHGTGLVSVLPLRKDTIGHLRGLRKAARPRGSVRIGTSRLDDMAELGRIDFLKIDIQGAELMVFENAVQALTATVAIQTEVNFFPLYEQQPSFGEIDVFLRKQGFLPHSYMHIEKRVIQSRFSGMFDRSTASQMLDGDILYLRDLSQAASWSVDHLKRTALLADGVYGYLDVACLCLDVLLQKGALSEEEVEVYLALSSS